MTVFSAAVTRGGGCGALLWASKWCRCGDPLLQFIWLTAPDVTGGNRKSRLVSLRKQCSAHPAASLFVFCKSTGFAKHIHSEPIKSLLYQWSQSVAGFLFV